MKGFEIITAMALNTQWQVVDLGMRAVANILLQCRTSVDVLLSTSPGISYFTLKKDTLLIFEPEGGIIGVSRGDELLLGGNFANAAEFALWTCDLADWTFDDGTDDVDKDQDGVTTLSQAFGSVAGQIYELTYTLVAVGAGNVTPSIGGTNGTNQTVAATYKECIQAVDDTGLIFTPSDTSRFTIDTISVKKLTRPKLFAKVGAATANLEIVVMK